MSCRTINVSSAFVEVNNNFIKDILHREEHAVWPLQQDKEKEREKAQDVDPRKPQQPQPPQPQPQIQPLLQPELQDGEEHRIQFVLPDDIFNFPESNQPAQQAPPQAMPPNPNNGQEPRDMTVSMLIRGTLD